MFKGTRSNEAVFLVLLDPGRVSMDTVWFKSCGQLLSGSVHICLFLFYWKCSLSCNSPAVWWFLHVLFVFKGLIGACGISVLYNLMRVYNFTQACRWDYPGKKERWWVLEDSFQHLFFSDSDSESKQRQPSLRNPLRSKWRASLQFWCLSVLLSLVGLRVASLIVLEFLLRAASALSSAGPVSSSGRLNISDQCLLSVCPACCASVCGIQDTRGVDFLLIQSQFSLGCSLTCTLAFLHQGAPHSSFSLLLAAGLSWALASYSSSLWTHVARLYPLHSTQHYCGKCISLLTSGHTILASLQKLVIFTFAVASLAATSTFYEHFLSHKDAIKFWTPLTLLYTMLVVYNQGK